MHLAKNRLRDADLVIAVFDGSRPLDDADRAILPLLDGKKSVAFSLVYRDRDKTLTDEEVTEVHSGVLDALKDKLNAVLREI